MATVNQTILCLPSQPNPPSNNHHNYLFSALSSSTTLTHLKQIHAQIFRTGLDRSTSFLVKLVLSSCALSSGLDYALSVFNHIHRPPPSLCNKFLRELSRSSQPEKTLLVYEKMRTEGISVDRFSFPPLLKASTRVSSIVEGMEIHGLATKLGFDSDPFIQVGLIGMYAACGRILMARLLFDKMSARDVVAWSIMIDWYE